MMEGSNVVSIKKTGSYEELEALVMAYQETKDEAIFDEIFKRCFPMLKGMAQDYTPIYGFDDRLSAYSQDLYTATELWDKQEGVRFTTYFRVLAKNSYRLMWKSAERSKRKAEATALSLDALIEESGDAGEAVVGFADSDYKRVELMDAIERLGLTMREKQVCILFALGYKTSEIAKMLGVTTSRVSGLCVRLRPKIKGVIGG